MKIKKWKSELNLCNYKLTICFRAIRHPASGYVQGINDLVTPFLIVFLSEHLQENMDKWSISELSSLKFSNIEADCYWCLTKLLDGMQDHYTFSQPGIQRLVFKLKELVRRINGMLNWLCSLSVCLVLLIFPFLSPFLLMQVPIRNLSTFYWLGPTSKKKKTLGLSLAMYDLIPIINNGNLLCLIEQH